MADSCSYRQRNALPHFTKCLMKACFGYEKMSLEGLYY